MRRLRAEGIVRRTPMPRTSSRGMQSMRRSWADRRTRRPGRGGRPVRGREKRGGSDSAPHGGCREGIGSSTVGEPGEECADQRITIPQLNGGEVRCRSDRICGRRRRQEDERSDKNRMHCASRCRDGSCARTGFADRASCFGSIEGRRPMRSVVGFDQREC